MTTDLVPARSATNGLGGRGGGACSFTGHHQFCGAGAALGGAVAGFLFPELGVALFGFWDEGQSDAASKSAVNSCIVGIGVARALCVQNEQGVRGGWNRGVLDDCDLEVGWRALAFAEDPPRLVNVEEDAVWRGLGRGRVAEVCRAKGESVSRWNEA